MQSPSQQRDHNARYNTPFNDKINHIINNPIANNGNTNNTISNNNNDPVSANHTSTQPKITKSTDDILNQNRRKYANYNEITDLSNDVLYLLATYIQFPSIVQFSMVNKDYNKLIKPLVIIRQYEYLVKQVKQFNQIKKIEVTKSAPWTPTTIGTLKVICEIVYNNNDLIMFYFCTDPSNNRYEEGTIIHGNGHSKCVTFYGLPTDTHLVMFIRTFRTLPPKQQINVMCMVITLINTSIHNEIHCMDIPAIILNDIFQFFTKYYNTQQKQQMGNRMGLIEDYLILRDITPAAIIINLIIKNIDKYNKIAIPHSNFPFYGKPTTLESIRDQDVRMTQIEAVLHKNESVLMKKIKNNAAYGWITKVTPKASRKPYNAKLPLFHQDNCNYIAAQIRHKFNPNVIHRARDGKEYTQFVITTTTQNYQPMIFNTPKLKYTDTTHRLKTKYHHFGIYPDNAFFLLPRSPMANIKILQKLTFEQYYYSKYQQDNPMNFEQKQKLQNEFENNISLKNINNEYCSHQITEYTHASIPVGIIKITNTRPNMYTGY